MTTSNDATGASTARWATAFIGSFGVYLIPLVGPHAVWFFGEQLFRELTEHPGPPREPAWIATDVGLALAAQVVAFLVLVWAIKGGAVRKLVAAATVPLFFFTIESAYLVVIPSRFLIESDTAAERLTWAEHCVVDNASLMAVRTPVTLAASGVREWWVQRMDGRLALLRVPSCELTEAALPQPTVQPGGRVDFSLGIQFAVRGGTAIFERYETSTSRRTFWRLTDPSAPLVAVPEPADKFEGSPILANGGDAVAWMQQIAGTGPPFLERVLIRAVQPAQFQDVVVDLTPFGAASYVLLEVDSTARKILLWQNDGPLVVGFDGKPGKTDHEHLPRPWARVGTADDQLRPQSTTYQRSGDHWLAWDAYRDQDPYRLMWSLPAGSGQHGITKGRSVTSASIDPTGNLIAISATTTLSIGRARDVVYVIGAVDGTDVFRRYVPRYTRTSVVFFDAGLFGYTENGRTHMLDIRN